MNQHPSSPEPKEVATALQQEQRRRLQAELKVAELKAALNQSQQQSQRYDDSLQQNEKMASLGLLSAGIAHEINNPVGYIISNVSTLNDYLKGVTAAVRLLAKMASLESDEQELTEMRLEAQRLIVEQDMDFLLDDIEELIQETLQGAERVRGIVSGLKNYAGKNTDELAYANVNDCLNNTLALVGNELKYHCKVDVELGQLPNTCFSEGKLGQVFLNLLVNAGQAIVKRGAIRVDSFLQDATIVVKIADNGAGMTQEQREHIFEPFYTTKPKGLGTGLGLSISKGIIEEHGGEIRVTSSLGAGTTFTIYLPVREPSESQ